MCGIAGICTNARLSRSALDIRLSDMAYTIRHRGPDENGTYVGRKVALASRRLKIIDLETGRMPITNETGTVVTVYNGEIYNYAAIRRDLERAGHNFRTEADTEVLVHLYEEYGIRMIERLNGMFAFALWDADRESLFLARDRLGIKPIFYRLDGDTLLFGSELKCLLVNQSDASNIAPKAIANYLALGYIRAPRTIYRDCKKLPPGTVLEFRNGTARSWPYWSFPSKVDPGMRSEAEAIDQLEYELQRSVRERLVADVPVGSFLSGGIDSSLVVALAAEHAGGRLKTFSVGFEGRNELPYAKQVAQRFDTEHYELVLHPENCRITGALLDAYDEPFGDSSSIPAYFVSQLARRHVTVALSGDGGDELFAGYDQYAYDARWSWVDRIPARLRAFAFGIPTENLPSGTYGWNRLRALAASRAERYAMYVTHELDPSLDGLLAPELFAEVRSKEHFFATAFAKAAALPFPARLLYADATSYLPGDILTKVDRMSMAHSLEARVPLLDHRLVEFAASMPMHWKLRDGQRKWILKRVAERYLPSSILRRPKHGFSIPVSQWFRRELRDRLELLLHPTAHSSHYLYRPTIERLIREHRKGRRDHSYVLWRVLMLELWLRRTRGADIGPIPDRSRATVSV